SGWQQADFPVPVAITAGTTYVISYHSSQGGYSLQSNGFSGPVSNGPLTALASGTDGENGVFVYSAVPAFPNSSYQAGNYWVDVVFDTTGVPTNELPTVSLTSPGDHSVFTAPADIEIAATASDADGTVSLVEFFRGSVKIGESSSAPYTFSWENVPAGSYTLTAVARDNDGGSAASAAVSITVNAAPGGGCPCTVFLPGQAPSGVLRNDGEPLQLGMKFRASEDGMATGVRFYKQAGNSGTHTGQLYSVGGELLASAVFEDETPSGWQQADFPVPV